MTDTLVYKATVSASASGQAYNIVSSSGAVVATGVVGAADSSGGNVAIRATLPEGTYNVEGQRAAWPGTAESVMTVDLAGSIAAAAPGGGASETAKFIGTATCDTSGATAALTWVQDGEQDWASTDGDTITLEGPLLFSIKGRQGGTLDFTDATGYTSDHTGPYIEGFITYTQGSDFSPKNCFNDQFFPVGVPGEVLDVDAVLSQNGSPLSNSGNAAGVTITGTVAAHGYDTDGVAVDDGTYEATFSLWVIRDTDFPDLPS